MRKLLFATALVAVGCSRTPPEPAPTVEPRSTTVPQTQNTGSSQNAGRCITPLSKLAPIIPNAATGSACPTDPEGDVKMPVGEATFQESLKIGKLEVELAKNEHDIQHGLMYRRTMSDEHGMLFKLDGRKDQTFWMHNTCLPLDMMFIDDDGTIVGIVEGAAPLTDTTRSVGCPSVFVLEVNAGWSRKRGVQPGQKVNLPFAAR